MSERWEPIEIQRFEAQTGDRTWIFTFDLSATPDDVWTDMFLNSAAVRRHVGKTMFPTFEPRQITVQFLAWRLGDAVRLLEDTVDYANRTYEATVAAGRDIPS